MSYQDPPLITIDGNPHLRQAITELRRAIIELARQSTFRDLTVSLPDATAVVVRHGLGRAHLFYAVGVSVGALSTGRIDQVAADSDSVTLQATGYGATISVPVRFW